MQEVSHAPMRLHLLHQHRRRVQKGLEAAIEEICKLALDDILRQYFRPAGLALRRNSIEFAPHRKDVGESSRHGGSGEGSSSGAARRVLVKGQEGEVRPDDRTILLTFSKGYPVSHEELVDFFTKVCGDTFETIKMEKVPEDVQRKNGAAKGLNDPNGAERVKNEQDLTNYSETWDRFVRRSFAAS